MELRRPQLRLARLHPVGVAAQRVDLAVVRDVAEWLREVPGRERVGREPRVHDGERRREIGLAEVAIEQRQLRRQQQALVDDRLGRQRRDVEHVRRIEAGVADPVLGEPADDVEGSLPRARWNAAHADVDLTKHRHDLAREAAGLCGIDGDVAPADDPLTLGVDDIFEDALTRGALLGIARQEQAANAEPAVRVQIEAEPLRLAPQERLGQLEQDAGTVAGLGIGAARASVREPSQHLEPLIDDIARARTLDVDDKADAARVEIGGEEVGHDEDQYNASRHQRRIANDSAGSFRSHRSMMHAPYRHDGVRQASSACVTRNSHDAPNPRSCSCESL